MGSDPFVTDPFVRPLCPAMPRQTPLPRTEFLFLRSG